MQKILALAWPIIVSRSTQVVVGLADALMVVHLGESAMAAVTAGSLNAVAALILPQGVVFIVASFSSQLAGQGRGGEARRYAWYGLAVAGLAQVLIAALLPLLPRALGALEYAPEVETLMTGYLRLRLLSAGFAVGLEALANYYGGLGDTRAGMRANMLAMALNVFFNWLLIDGRCGFPALGVNGAAWGTLLSVLAGFTFLLAQFLREGPGPLAAGLRLKEFGRTLRFGLPNGVNWALEFYAFIAFVNIVVAGLGTTSLAAMMAVFQINSVAFMPAFGLAGAGAILVGHSIGAGRKDEVPAIVRDTFYLSAGWMGLAAAFYLLFPRPLMSAFASPGSEEGFLAVGVGMLALSALWQVFDAAGMTLSEALRAAGDTAVPMWVRGAVAWGFFFPGSWLAVRRWGGRENTAMLFLSAYLLLVALILLARFRAGAWRRVVLVPEDAA